MGSVADQEPALKKITESETCRFMVSL